MAANNAKDNDRDLEFIYDDCDEHANEISELYSYTEEIEFDTNLKNFEILLNSKGHSAWNDLGDDVKELLVMHIIQVIEHADKSERFKAITWLLYLVQGTYGECTDAKQQTIYCRKNCILLYKMGVFSITRELLMMEVSMCDNLHATSKKSTQLTIADSKELRSLFIILYTMVETLRQEDCNDTPETKKTREEFLHDLGQSLNDSESLVIVLFNMVVKFCSDTSSSLPMKKVLLLIWKLLLTILGGYKSIDVAKIHKRKEAGLPVLDEDPIQIVRDMKASVPPTSASDILEIAQAPKRRRARSTLYEIDGGNADGDLDGGREKTDDSMPLEEEKVTSIDDDLMVSSIGKLTGSDIVEAEETVVDPFLDKTNGVLVMGGEDLSKDEGPVDPGVATPIPIRKAPTLSKDTASIAAKLIKLRKQQQEAEEEFPLVKIVSGLPWIPKAREKDVEAFLNLVRQKFIGFALPGDLTTEAGLPNPTKDSIAVLRRHQYKSLTELQVAKEVEISKFPLTLGKKEVVPDTLTERLYQAMLPNLPQYMIALLKILLAAAPTAKSKNESINILTDVLPEEMPTPNSTILTMKVGIDVNRHREIIVKSVSGILLLLLKHFKLSHVYQFEYASQHLVFANCIPLVLKFFNQNIVAYVTTKNTIPTLEFPECVIGEKKELTADSLEGIDNSTSPCWRNLFSSISLLRILNKLVKWKHSRTMMLVVFKSAPILKRALKVRQAMFQLYVLKLLKVQTKYLGRQWRKSNMKIMSAIYQKVRHRLNDDWAYGNDLDARPWDFQQEECALRAFVERFNLRRYHVTGSRTGGTPNVLTEEEDADYYQPVDNNIQNLLREEMDLPSDFQKSYDVWLEREVYCSSTDWDQLMTIPCVQ